MIFHLFIPMLLISLAKAKDDAIGTIEVNDEMNTDHLVTSHPRLDNITQIMYRILQSPFVCEKIFYEQSASLYDSLNDMETWLPSVQNSLVNDYNRFDLSFRVSDIVSRLLQCTNQMQPIEISGNYILLTQKLVQFAILLDIWDINLFNLVLNARSQYTVIFETDWLNKWIWETAVKQDKKQRINPSMLVTLFNAMEYIPAQLMGNNEDITRRCLIMWDIIKFADYYQLGDPVFNDIVYNWLHISKSDPNYDQTHTPADMTEDTAKEVEIWKSRCVYNKVLANIRDLLQTVAMNSEQDRKDRFNFNKHLFDVCDALLQTLIQNEQTMNLLIQQFGMPSNYGPALANDIYYIIDSLLTHRKITGFESEFRNVHILIRKLVEFTIKLDIWNDDIFEIVCNAYVRKHQTIIGMKQPGGYKINPEFRDTYGMFADRSNELLYDSFEWVFTWVWQNAVKIDSKGRVTPTTLKSLFNVFDHPFLSDINKISDQTVKQKELDKALMDRTNAMWGITYYGREYNLIDPDFAQLLDHWIQVRGSRGYYNGMWRPESFPEGYNYDRRRIESIKADWLPYLFSVQMPAGDTYVPLF